MHAAPTCSRQAHHRINELSSSSRDASLAAGAAPLGRSHARAHTLRRRSSGSGVPLLREGGAAAPPLHLARSLASADAAPQGAAPPPALSLRPPVMVNSCSGRVRAVLRRRSLIPPGLLCLRGCAWMLALAARPRPFALFPPFQPVSTPLNPERQCTSSTHPIHTPSLPAAPPPSKTNRWATPPPRRSCAPASSSCRSP